MTAAAVQATVWVRGEGRSSQRHLLQGPSHCIGPMNITCCCGSRWCNILQHSLLLAACMLLLNKPVPAPCAWQAGSGLQDIARCNCAVSDKAQQLPVAKKLLKIPPEALVVGPGVYPLLLIHFYGGAIGCQHVAMHNHESCQADRKGAADDHSDEGNSRPEAITTEPAPINMCFCSTAALPAQYGTKQLHAILKLSVQAVQGYGASTSFLTERVLTLHSALLERR